MKDASLGELHIQGFFNIRPDKGLRIPEHLCVMLHFLVGQGDQISFTILTHNVKHAHDNVITNSPVSIQADQLTFLVAEDAVSISDADDFDKPLIQHDLTADLRLKTIAEKLNVNSSYLSSLFHKEYGCTLTEFINKQRIDRGIQLLQQTAKPVQEIAAECGIQDVNYFIKLFKKQTGFTPNRYRAQGSQHE